MENEELYRGLVILLKMFKNRPYHLAKYLVENNALTNDFIKKVISSDRLKKITEEPEQKMLPVPIYFIDISKMDSFYNSFIYDQDEPIYGSKDINEITIELNEKLNNFIKVERFEEAARVRDYMIINNIKRL